jgi:hypothetical protein
MDIHMEPEFNGIEADPEGPLAEPMEVSGPQTNRDLNEPSRRQRICWAALGVLLFLSAAGMTWNAVSALDAGDLALGKTKAAVALGFVVVAAVCFYLAMWRETEGDDYKPLP